MLSVMFGPIFVLKSGLGENNSQEYQFMSQFSYQPLNMRKNKANELIRKNCKSRPIQKI